MSDRFARLPIGSAFQSETVKQKIRLMKTNATAEVRKITPEIANEWLEERWGEQRTVRTAHVNRLAADMEAGRFKTSPDAILRIKGKLANGQHRLTAVVQSGKPQQFLVMESNDEELYKVIDAGLRRTVADGLIGIQFAKSIPSIARWVQAYENRNLRQGSRCGSEASVVPGTNYWPTQSELIDYCLGNQEVLSEAATYVNPLYTQTKLLPLSIGAAIYALAASRNGHLEKAKTFLQQVYLDGGSSAAGDLRNRLIANRGSKAKLNAGYLFGITIKAFKSYYNGTRPGVLKWAKDEELPTI